MIRRQTSKDYIADSLMELLYTTPLQNISTQQICDNCGYSTRTFYNNFKDKHEVVAYIYERMMQNCWYDNGEITDLYTAHVRWNTTAAKEYHKFFKNTLSYKGQNNIMDIMNDYAVARYKDLMIKHGYREKITPDIEKTLRMYHQGRAYEFEKLLYSATPEKNIETTKEQLYEKLPRIVYDYLVEPEYLEKLKQNS